MSGVRIDRCLCHKVTFLELRREARRTNADSLGELQVALPFGSQCGLCRPYVRRMLETGQVVFSEILIEDDDGECGT